MQMKPKVRVINELKRIRKMFLSGRTFVAFDTETTGLSSQEDHIIEIGAVKFTSGAATETFGSLIKPPVSIPPLITSITGINDAMVSSSPSAPEVLGNFMDFVGDGQVILLAHNANFDVKFLNSELSRAGMRNATNLVVDTLRISRSLHPDFKGTCDGPFTLQSLASRYSVKVESAHRASDDARVCMELFRIFMDELESDSEQDLSTTSEE